MPENNDNRIDFISDVSGESFYMAPVIAPLSIRKYSVGVNTDNNTFKTKDGVFFISSREINSENIKNKVYFVSPNQGNYIKRSINIDSGKLNKFIIDGGTWS